MLVTVLCELGKVDRRKKSRENREQLRCCNWIQLPTGPIAEINGLGFQPMSSSAGCRCHVNGEGGKKVRCHTGIISQEPEYLSGPPHSVAVGLCPTPVRLMEMA